MELANGVVVCRCGLIAVLLFAYVRASAPELEEGGVLREEHYATTNCDSNVLLRSEQRAD
jgi:hypothetical protein